MGSARDGVGDDLVHQLGLGDKMKVGFVLRMVDNLYGAVSGAPGGWEVLETELKTLMMAITGEGEVLATKRPPDSCSACSITYMPPFERSLGTANTRSQYGAPSLLNLTFPSCFRYDIVVRTQASNVRRDHFRRSFECGVARPPALITRSGKGGDARTDARTDGRTDTFWHNPSSFDHQGVLQSKTFLLRPPLFQGAPLRIRRD